MELKQHVKGILIAIGSAIVILFVVSFFVGSEVRVSKSYVLNNKVDSVYTFLKDPKNFQKWLDGSQEFKVNYLKEDGGIQYEGFQGDLHTFRYLTIDKINGLEIVYKREDDEMAVIKFKATAKNNGTILEYEKVWKISNNPIVKVVSMNLDEDIEEGMKKDIKRLKKEL